MIQFGLFSMAVIGITNGLHYPLFPESHLSKIFPNHMRPIRTPAVLFATSIGRAYYKLRSEIVSSSQTAGERDSYIWHHRRTNNGPKYQTVMGMSNEAELSLLSQKILINKLPAAQPLRFNPRELMEWRKYIAPYCTAKPPEFTCNQNDIFRTADGTCNNFRHPEWGSSMRKQRRFLPPAYLDGFNAPRSRSVTGRPLPSARLVSNVVHSCGKCVKLGRFTSMLMSFGQFFVHDVVQTPMTNGEDEIDCCDIRNKRHRNCFSIEIPPNDPQFGNKGCMPLSRSVAVPRPYCDPDVREQTNQLTSYIDASNVYGSDTEQQHQLREGRYGLMKTSPTGLLPRVPDSECIISNNKDHCFAAGDTRNHEVPTLSTLHLVYVRDHNWLAMGLRAINPHWNDERIFQEARKIISAVMQHTTYNEYLPIIIGRKHMKIFGLTPRRYGYNTIYNPKVDATAGNAFSVAAFRFGHSTVPEVINLVHDDFIHRSVVPLHTEFNRPRLFFEERGYSRMVRGMINDLKTPQDGQLPNSVRNLLFFDKEKNSLDLAALNIQRGRDHGVKAYNHWRRWCGLRPAIHFGVGPGGLEHHDPHTASLLAKVYKHPDDIDLFTGGLSEKRVPGGLLGPTFACMMARQFKNLKEGDRFWYENKFPKTGFTLAQLNEIRKITLASTLCNNADLSVIQPLAFELPSARNNRRHCRSFPKINLKYWKEIVYPSLIPRSPLSNVLGPLGR